MIKYYPLYIFIPIDTSKRFLTFFLENFLFLGDFWFYKIINNKKKLLP